MNASIQTANALCSRGSLVEIHNKDGLLIDWLISWMNVLSTWSFAMAAMIEMTKEIPEISRKFTFITI